MRRKERILLHNLERELDDYITLDYNKEKKQNLARIYKILEELKHDEKCTVQEVVQK